MGDENECDYMLFIFQMHNKCMTSILLSLSLSCSPSAVRILLVTNCLSFCIYAVILYDFLLVQKA